jgi:DNA mismatch repair protein MutS2
MPQRVLALARQHISTGTVRVERLLSQIQAERAEISRLFERSKGLHEDARKLRDRLQSEVGSVQREREGILAAAREEAAGLVRQLRADLRRIESGAKGQVSRRDQRELQAQIETVQREAAERFGPLPSTAAPEVDEPELRPLREGATVNVLSWGQQGTVLNVSDGEAEVQMGQFKMRVPVDDLEVLGRKDRRPEPKISYQPARDAPPMEIDVRGWRADDAVREIDQYLHDNYMHGQGTVRIIHGKGTGALRKAIREQLESHPLVKSHQSEDPKQGGEGATVVKLAL